MASFLFLLLYVPLAFAAAWLFLRVVNRPARVRVHESMPERVGMGGAVRRG